MARRFSEAYRPDALFRQVKDLCDNFDTYLAEFNSAPLYNDTLSQHKNMLGLRIKLGGIAKSIDSDEYLRDLRFMLVAWGMDSRGAKLQKYDTFVASVRACRRDIAALEDAGVEQMDQIDGDIKPELWRIIQGMKLSQSKYSQIVTGTKALHHMLPHLLPPIDGGYTRPFFRYQSTQTKDNKYAFNLMLEFFALIAQRVDLECRVGKSPWATSESKLIDNAIIGYCNRHLGLLKKYNYNWRARRYKENASVKAKAEARVADAHIDDCEFCQTVMGS